jgi:hypothetical protein
VSEGIVRRVLVVANRTLDSPTLADRLRELAAESACHFHLLVPAEAVHDAPADDELRDPALPPSALPAARVEVARERLYAALDRLHHAGVAATGEVGDDDLVDLVRAAVESGAYDDVLVSTLPAGASRWLKLDLPSRVQRVVPIPVMVVESTTA